MDKTKVILEKMHVKKVSQQLEKRKSMQQLKKRHRWKNKIVCCEECYVTSVCDRVEIWNEQVPYMAYEEKNELNGHANWQIRIASELYSEVLVCNGNRTKGYGLTKIIGMEKKLLASMN